MAASLFASSSGGVELSDVISCVWCKRQHLTQLVQLGCFHLACKVCLQRKIEDPSPGTPFNCPECDMLCMVPMEGLDGFPDEPIQHKMHQITMIFSNDKPKCKPCDQVGVVSNTSNVCVTCKINLCENDAKRHQGTPGHTVILHQEVCVEPNLSLMLKTKANICQEHASEKNYFCKNCDVQICSDCGMLNHSEHKKDSAKNIAAKYRKELEGKLEEMETTKRVATENIQKMEEMLSKIQEMHKISVEKSQYERKGDATENLMKLARESNEKTSQIKDQITERLQKIKQCQSAGSYLKFFFNCSSDLDMINKFQEFLSNFENSGITEEYEGACALSEKVQNIGLNKNVNETKGVVTTTKLISWELEAKWKSDNWWKGVCVTKDQVWAVAGNAIRQFELNGRPLEEFGLNMLGDATDIAVCDNEVYVADKKKRNRVVLVLDMDWKLQRKLILPEKEDKRGGELGLAVHEVSKDVYVCSASTNTVYKCEHRSQQFLPWITKRLDRPKYLCVTLDHSLVVSNYGSDSVNKYSPQGKIVWRYQKLLNPYGVCTDPWDHVYISDSWHNRVVVVSDGKWVMNVDIGEKIKSPGAITFENDRLAVAADKLFGNMIMYVIKKKHA